MHLKPSLFQGRETSAGLKFAAPSPALKDRWLAPLSFLIRWVLRNSSPMAGLMWRPHPHIGLGTVTYLYNGEFEHRDSIGTHQMIYPGEVNWMIAGKGVTHSERTSAETRATKHSLFGIQTWIALPEDKEEMEPDFEHHKEAALPTIEDNGVSAKLILGTAYGKTSPVTMQSETFLSGCDAGPLIEPSLSPEQP